MTISLLIARYGLPILFLAGAIDAETIVIGAGLLAHEGVLAFAPAALAAGIGSLAATQGLFMLGRLSRRRPWAAALAERPSVGRVLRLVERRPTTFILGYRYLYGVRIISPVAIGMTQVSAWRFAVVNAVAAAAWALLFTALGYGFGHGVEMLFGEVSHVAKLVALLALAALVGLALHQLHVRRRG